MLNFAGFASQKFFMNFHRNFLQNFRKSLLTICYDNLSKNVVQNFDWFLGLFLRILLKNCQHTLTHIKKNHNAFYTYLGTSSKCSYTTQYRHSIPDSVFARGIQKVFSSKFQKPCKKVTQFLDVI